MTLGKGTLKERLARYREITLTVTGRKSGKDISVPVWFIVEGDQFYLLPVHGSDTQWYLNVLKNPRIRIDAGGETTELRVKTMTDSKSVKSVVDKFRDKYTAADVRKYYSKLDVAVVAKLD